MGLLRARDNVSAFLVREEHMFVPASLSREEDPNVGSWAKFGLITPS